MFVAIDTSAATNKPIQSSTPHLVQITGAVKFVDLSLGLPNVTVSLEGNGVQVATQTNDAGVYRLVAAPGIYRLTFKGAGCAPIHLAAFRLKASDMKLPDIRLEPCVMNPARIEYDFKEDRFGTVARINQPAELIIRYGERVDIKGIRHYGGFLVSYEDKTPRSILFGAMASYDGLLIYADKLSFNKKKLILQAQGHVTAYKGNMRLQGERLSVNLRAKNPAQSIRIRIN